MDFDTYRKNVLGNKNASPFNLGVFSQKFMSTPDIIDSYKPQRSPFAFNPDLDTSRGLYEMSVRAGLKSDADRILKNQGGEEAEFLSGGFIQDVFDVLNAGSYGMVGVAKGEGFFEGIKNRSTFADEDSLGKYGFMGKVLGVGLDIALDPLTYVAPLKVLSKIPGVARALTAANKKALGEFTEIAVDGGGRYTKRVGGWQPLTFIADKFSYGFGVDKKHLEALEMINDSAEVAKNRLHEYLDPFSKIDPKYADKTLEWKDGGYIGRKSLEDLRAEMLREPGVNADDLINSAKPLYEMIERNADELTELGFLSQSTRTKYHDEYLVQLYQEFAEAKMTKPAAGKSGVRLDYRARKEMTEQMRKEKKIIENSSVVLGATITKQIEMLRAARLLDYISKNTAFNSLDELPSFVSKKDFHRVPDAANYKIRRSLDEKAAVKELNKSIRNIKKQRSDVLSDAASIEREVDALRSMMTKLDADSQRLVSEAISGIRKKIEEGGIKLGPRKKVPTSEGQQILAKQVRKFLNSGKKADVLARETIDSKELLEEFLTTKEGLALERAFDNPQMMYQWDSPLDFFESVRRPDRAIIAAEPGIKTKQVSDTAGTKMIKAAEKKQRKLGKAKVQLESTEVLSELINKNLSKIEEDYADMLFEKTKLLDTINVNEMGNLAGKYVPKEIWDMVKGTFEPKKEFGEAAVLTFKHAKVIWNPSSYARNMVSASIQNWWKLGLGPWRVDIYLDAAQELKSKGKYFREMEELGFHETVGQAGELIDNVLSTQVFQDAITKGSNSPLLKLKTQFQNTDRFLRNAYTSVDNIAKVAGFKHQRKLGRSPEEALALAYAATFNYSQVTPFVMQMRKAMWGVPFITFNLKATGLVADTMINNPQRISFFGKVRNALWQSAGVEADQEAEAMPEWMRDNFMLRLPWKDEGGRSMYFDVSYIIPFGSIVTGEYAKNPMSSNPALQTIKELSQNRTFSGNRIFNESDSREEVIFDVFAHVAKLSLPPEIIRQLPDGYNSDGERLFGGVIGKLSGREARPNDRTFYQETMRMIGLGVTPYDLEARQGSLEYRRKAALTTLLSENNILDEFAVPYLPEDSPAGPPASIRNDTEPVWR